MTIRPRHTTTRPFDEPVHTNPTGMDFEKRELLVTQVSGSTVGGMMSTIADAIVVYDGVVISYSGDTVYKL
ncbi:hypothetical protein LCGC14_0408520 [marine sediment metagenome]|uniref:Uncharacterized protein n=1 Tax=marine sediment metagenome TaxID=412755 RepID=A0A0F9SUF7_9ZZZZ